jgi:chemotaxis protein histidine kinase CheA
MDMAQWQGGVSQRPAVDFLGPVDAFVARLAKRLGREVHFELVGGQTLVDPRCTGEVLTTLTHLLRNAVDHGLEPDWERGDKPTVGRLRLELSRSLESWRVVVSDDGRGIQVDALTQRAMEAGSITAEQAQSMSQEEQLNLVFLQGLSSMDQPNEISGRGVGMAAVYQAVERAGGTLQVQTESGEGTRIQIDIPLPELMRGAA